MVPTKNHATDESHKAKEFVQRLVAKIPFFLLAAEFTKYSSKVRKGHRHGLG
jgi:hypothetical protein